VNQNDNFKYTGIGLPEDILHLKEAGYFDRAIRLIDMRIADETTPECMRRNLIAQREMIVRLPKNFPVPIENALSMCRERIPDFTDEEFEHYMDTGRINWIFIEGKQHLAENFLDTLVKEPEIAARLPKAPAEGSHEMIDRGPQLNRAAAIMRENGSMSARIRIRHAVRIMDENFTPGETYRVHIPLPVSCIQQSEIEILATSSEPTHVAPENADQRTIFWEKTLQENELFWVEYSYKHTAPYVNPAEVEADEVQPEFFTGEVEPHIVFTPYVKALVEELTAGVTDPVEKARRFYDFVTTRVKYSFVPEYFVMPQIADGCLKNRRGDCGVQALAFITLCRCAGIPAKWQSGQVVFPGRVGCHDWAMFYVAPKGWMFADCSFGGSAYRAGDEKRREHYFGNLDVYRNVTVNTFQSDYDPPARFWRDDPYDNQVGNVETLTKPLRLGEFWPELEVVSFEEL